METKVIEIKGRTTICIWDEEEEVWTLSLLERGGPIISDKNFDEAVENFKLGLDACLFISLMVMHDKMSKAGASDEEIKEAWKKKRKF